MRRLLWPPDSKVAGSNPTPTAKKYREQEVDQQVSPAFPIFAAGVLELPFR